MTGILRKPSTIVYGVSVCCLLGCASIGTQFDPAQVDALQPGMTLAQVQARLGKPNSEVLMSDGRRIETWLYSHATALGTGGARSVGLLFDADGHFVRVLSRTQTDLH